MNPEAIARAFSSHDFESTFSAFSETLEWVRHGHDELSGRDQVTEACREASDSMRDIDTTWRRFVVAAGSNAVAVDAIGEYTESSGHVSVVSSCDVYEFDGDTLVRITTYAVDLDAR